MSDDSCVLDDVSLDLLEEERFDLEVDVLKLSEVFCVLLPNWALEEEGLLSGELDLRNGELDLEGSGRFDLGVDVLKLSEVFGVLLPDWALEEEGLGSGELDLEGSGGELDLGVKELDLEDGGEESLVDKVDWLEDEEHWDESSDSLKYIIIKS